MVGLNGVWEANNGDLNDPALGSGLELIAWTYKQGVTTVNSTSGSVTFHGYPSRFGKFFLNITVPTGPADFNDSIAAGWITVNIQDYTWFSPSANDSSLVFTWITGYSVDEEVQANITLKSKAGKTIDFSDAYFAINRTAASGNETIDASLALASAYTSSPYALNDQIIYVAYDNFESDLVHDPQFGFGSGPGSNLLWIIIIVVVILAILVIILIAVIGFVLVRRRRKAYDTF